MAGPIGGTFSPAELNQLQTIWENLPNADAATLKADIQKLTQLAKAHPNSNLSFIVDTLTNLGPIGADGADLQIAYDLYPQMPNLMPSNMASQLSSLIKEFNANPYEQNPEKLTQYLQQLQGLLTEAQKMQPPTPQSTLIVNGIEQAIAEVQSSMTGMYGPGGLGSVTGMLQYLLPKS